MSREERGWMNQYPYRLLTEYFIAENGITETTPYEIKEISARELVVPERIDLMAKWIYIDMVEKGMNPKEARELYKKHIEAFSQGTFIEPGSEDKNTFDRYLEEFEKVCSSIKHNGFNAEESLIPVGKDNVLLDGSHRCASAAYFGKRVKIIIFNNLYRNYGTAFFKGRFLDDEYLDWMTWQYCCLKRNLFFACLWPVSGKELRKKAVDEIATSCGKIVYQREIKLNYTALRNLMIQIYGEQKWIGTVENHYEGVDEKVKACYANRSMTIVLFHCDSLDKVIAAKQKIRDMYGLKNHSIHITDNDKETKLLADILLNRNSLHLIRKGNLDYSGKVDAVIQRVCNGDDSATDSCIVGPEGTMAIYGFVKSKDEIRMLTYEELKKSTMMKRLGMNASDLLYNPHNYLIFNGTKFFSLKNAREWEKNFKARGERFYLKRMGYQLKLSLCNINIVESAKEFLTKHKKKQYVENENFSEKVKGLVVHILNRLHLLGFALKLFHCIKK